MGEYFLSAFTYKMYIFFVRLSAVVSDICLHYNEYKLH